MSHWLSHIGPKERPLGFEASDWWNLPEAEFLAYLQKENQDYEDHYPCDDNCWAWLDELVAAAARFEELYPGKAPWRKV